MRNHSAAAPGPLPPIPFEAVGVPGLDVSESTWAEWDAAVSQQPHTGRVTVRNEAPAKPRHGDYWLRAILARR